MMDLHLFRFIMEKLAKSVDSFYGQQFSHDILLVLLFSELLYEAAMFANDYIYCKTIELMKFI